MARFASNKRAFGYSERSGFKYKLSDMRKEWNGLTVGYDEYDSMIPETVTRSRTKTATYPTEIEHTAMLASGPGPDIEYIAGCSITISLFDNSAFEGFIFINPDRSTI